MGRLQQAQSELDRASAQHPSLRNSKTYVARLYLFALAHPARNPIAVWKTNDCRDKMRNAR
jgi:hypothetical protein